MIQNQKKEDTVRNFFAMITIGLIVVGFIVPLAWGAALISGVLAMSSTPPGLRADGKKKCGGLLGGFVDDYQVAKHMTDCPFCQGKVKKIAKKCPHCGEWVKQKSHQPQPR